MLPISQNLSTKRDSESSERNSAVSRSSSARTPMAHFTVPRPNRTCLMSKDVEFDAEHKLYNLSFVSHGNHKISAADTQNPY